MRLLTNQRKPGQVFRLPSTPQLPNRIERERRVCERGRGELQQPDRIVVAGDAVWAQLLAALAAMDQHPLVFAHPDGDGLHRAAAAGCAVARTLVDMHAPEAARAVV